MVKKPEPNGQFFMDNGGDVFVSVTLAGHTEIHGEPPTRWLVAKADDLPRSCKGGR